MNIELKNNDNGTICTRPDDIHIIKQYLKRAGYEVPDWFAYALWQTISEDMSASWLIIGTYENFISYIRDYIVIKNSNDSKE